MCISDGCLQHRHGGGALWRWWLPATFELNLPSMMTSMVVFFIQTFPCIFLRPSLRLSGPQTEQTRCLRVRRAADATSLSDCSYVTEARGASPGSQQHSAHNTSTAQHQTPAENDWEILRKLLILGETTFTKSLLIPDCIFHRYQLFVQLACS